MLGRLFPRSFDNAYRGNRLAPWMLGAVALVKGLQGFNSMTMPVKVMVSADGIALSTFNPPAQQEAIAMFALLGMYLLVLPLVTAVALVRYRSMIPFLYLMFIAVQLGARALNALNSPSSGHPIGFFINLGVLAVTVLGFVLSLMPGRGAAEAA